MTTTVNVDEHRSLGRIDRRIFGGFVEHLGRCIYGGLYEEGSPLSDERGFRMDVMELLQGLRLSVLRWPGGNFVSNYHWRDGIGPRDNRPTRMDLAWGDSEPNQFGTDEYLAYCATLGAEPYICLNMGSGTLEEALSWVEYCNSDRATAGAELRRSNGHAAPYKVKWWGLGNEIYGSWQIGALSSEEYVAEATRWGRAIKRLDPEVKLVSCGQLGWTDWDARVIDGLAGLVDLHSVHLYTGSDDYWTNVLAPHAAERAISTAAALLARAAYVQRLKAPPRIAYDEWNVWFRQITGALEERFVFADALAVGTFLNIFVRNCEWVAMANLAQMVNAIAPIVTTTKGVAVQPTYYPFLLHAEGHLDRAVDTFVEGPTVQAPTERRSRWPHRVHDLGPFSLVDASASVDDATARLAVTLVNRSQTPEKCTIALRRGRFNGKARLRAVTEPPASGPPGELAGANLEEGDLSAAGKECSLTLPASSFVLLEAAIGN